MTTLAAKCLLQRFKVCSYQTPPWLTTDQLMLIILKMRPFPHKEVNKVLVRLDNFKQSYLEKYVLWTKKLNFTITLPEMLCSVCHIEDEYRQNNEYPEFTRKTCLAWPSSVLFKICEIIMIMATFGFFRILSFPIYLFYEPNPPLFYDFMDSL